MFWILGSVLGFWDVFWDSGTCFGILGSVTGFWEVFWDSGRCFGILGSVLDSGTCFVLMSHRTYLIVFSASRMVSLSNYCI